MVEVSDSLMAEHLIVEALEFGTYDVPGTVGLGEYGQHEAELDWDIRDLDPEECDVFMDDGCINVGGTIEGTYSIMVSRGNRHHPPDYENKSVDIIITLTKPLETLDDPSTLDEVHVYGEIA